MVIYVNHECTSTTFVTTEEDRYYNYDGYVEHHWEHSKSSAAEETVVYLITRFESRRDSGYESWRLELM